MRKLLTLIVVLVLVCSHASAADKPWPIIVDGETLSVTSDSVLVTVGKVELKVHRCGQVQVQEWREIVPNKDAGWVTGGTVMYAATNIMAYTTGECGLRQLPSGLLSWGCESEKKLPDWKIQVNKVTFTISGEKDDALIDINKGVTKIKVTRDGEVRHLVPEKWVKVK
jgi:hypothetical protein